MARHPVDDRDPRAVSRREFVEAGLSLGALVALGAATPAAAHAAPLAPPATPAMPRASSGNLAPFALEEKTLAELQDGMQRGEWTARALAEQYIARVHELDPKLRAVLEINPDALPIADGLDAERKAKGARGPLHGIPILIKDNIATADKMETTAGSLALVGHKPPRDAFVAARLREAGAVILGKTNLSEWANFRSSHSSSGWSGRGGQCRNPYALDRSPSGSSSGSGAATAANLCAAAIGTETDGSIVSPSSHCGIVGIKPTVGLVSRAGIIPIAHSQDTAGPMARTVADAAAILGALVGVDKRDPATAGSRGHAAADYTKYLDPNGLKGARIGVPRDHYYGDSDAIDALAREALDIMKAHGATIVDPANIPTAGKMGKPEYQVLLYEFKADLEAYLRELPDGAPRTLADLIAFDEQHRDAEMPYFGQDIFLEAVKKGPLSDPKYRKALADSKRLARTEGIDAAMSQHRLDALVAPTSPPSWLIDLVNGDCSSGGSSTPAAVAGYPSITVPMGQVRGLPVGLSFFGRAWSEPVLVRLAHAYEQVSKKRQVPSLAERVALG